MCVRTRVGVCVRVCESGCMRRRGRVIEECVCERLPWAAAGRSNRVENDAKAPWRGRGYVCV